MDIDGDLALVDVLRVVIYHDAVSLPILPEELLGAQYLIASVLAGDANDVKELLAHDSIAHQLFDFTLLVRGQTLGLRLR